jgi:glycosyltransferase involved in cell wall biosynthesis
MSRLFVLGYELPSLTTKAIEARNYRTWQFVAPLLDDGHELCLVVSHEAQSLHVSHDLGQRLHYHRHDMRQPGWLKYINGLYREFKPDGALAVTFNNCLRATRLPPQAPLWMDIYGDKLAEIQLAEQARQSDRGRRTTLRYLHAVLKRGDAYSVCGTPQRFALIGQLALQSRLNRATVGFELVHVVLPGFPNQPGLSPPGLTLKGGVAPPDAFIVLWCGGYNVWTDVDTLFRALEAAMQQHPQLVFVSVGGGVSFVQHGPYERFLELIKSSAYSERFFMLGWRAAAEIPGYYQQADVGVNLDAYHYETLLGTRTRLVEMMGHGLPVVSSLGCELSEMIRDHELGLTFPIGDAHTLYQQLLTIAEQPLLRRKLSANARSYTRHKLSFAETTSPLRTWARQPVQAPDHARPTRSPLVQEAQNYVRSVVRSFLWRFWALERSD